MSYHNLVRFHQIQRIILFFDQEISTKIFLEDCWAIELDRIGKVFDGIESNDNEKSKEYLPSEIKEKRIRFFLMQYLIYGKELSNVTI